MRKPIIELGKYIEGIEDIVSVQEKPGCYIVNVLGEEIRVRTKSDVIAITRAVRHLLTYYDKTSRERYCDKQ